MALQIGTIQGDIELDVSGVIEAEQIVKKRLISVNKQVAAAEKQAIKGGRSFSIIGKQAKNAVNIGFKPAKNAAQQFGFQMQDVIVQLQSGTSAFTVIAQQGSQMAGVFGAGGALLGGVIALAAALGGVLWRAMGDASDATDRAADSAADLAKEYFKLTDQAEKLAAFEAGEAMKRDAKEAIRLAAVLKDLREERDKLNKTAEIKQALGPASIIQNPRARRAGFRANVTTLGDDESAIVKALDREIVDIDNRLQSLNMQQEFRGDILDKFFAEESGEELSTPAPPGGGSTFDERAQKEIAALELRATLFGESDKAIEAEIKRFELAALNLFEEGSDEFLKTEQALADKRVELHQDVSDKLAAIDEREREKAERSQKRAEMTAIRGRQITLGALAQFGDQANQLIEESGKEGTAIAKAVFLAQKAIQVVQILAATQAAAVQAGAASAAGGPAAFFASAAVVEAAGLASAAIVAGLAINQTFEHGGIVGGSSFTGDRVNVGVNSGEMILNRSQQANLFKAANTGGGGASNISIVSNGTPQTITGSQNNRGETLIMINDAIQASERRSQNSLASGRGDMFAALQRGAKVERNLG